MKKLCIPVAFAFSGGSLGLLLLVIISAVMSPGLVSKPQRLSRIFVERLTIIISELFDSNLKMTARLYSLCFSQEKIGGNVFLDFFSYLKKCSSLTEKKAMHRSPRTVASCPLLIANRVAVVLLGPLGHFLFLCLLTVLWVNMGQALNNFKEQRSHTKSIIVSFFWVSKNHVSQSDLTAEALL